MYMCNKNMTSIEAQLVWLRCSQEHDCKLTREIVELVDREADLLVRNMGEQALEGERWYWLAA